LLPRLQTHHALVVLRLAGLLLRVAQIDADAAGRFKIDVVDDRDIVLAALRVARNGHLVDLRLAGDFGLEQQLLIFLRMMLTHAHDDRLAVGGLLAPCADAEALAKNGLYAL